MVALAVLRRNGAIGAKLLYPNDTVHMLASFMGWAEPVAMHSDIFASTSLGYQARLAMTSNVSAVTGACLVLRKAVFEGSRRPQCPRSASLLMMSIYA